MVELTFYGGVGEVGGNMFLLSDGDTKVFLDFGMNYTARRNFYTWPAIQPKDERGLLDFGLIPDLKGIYRCEKSEPSFDGVFLTHVHGDHTGYISLINRAIPVHCGETCSLILKAIDATSRKSFEKDLTGLKWKIFRTGHRVKIGSLEVAPVHVDHSVPGAYGFIIHTSEGTIAYTGDLRSHGTKPELTMDFVKKAGEEKPEAVICEGTNIMQARVSSEDEVEQKLNTVVASTKNIVLASFSYNDIDRLRTFYHVAQKNNRYLVVSLKQAYLLRELQKDPRLDVPDIMGDKFIVLDKEKKKDKWEREEIQKYRNVKTVSEIGKIQNKVIYVLSQFDLNDLVDIKPDAGSIYIYSSSEPFTEEGEIDFERMKNWLASYGLPLYQIHTSGHIMPHELVEIFKELKPKKLIPVHTEYPETFKKYFEKAILVELPTKNQTMKIF
ncbi:MAG: MBL fold metallo-hydrolase [Candidatus Jordarchaeum sp.]|uniref:MBL fold metallo-hydrolase n=1 Tax=Candidatus Jordarchaeum sp. TaxID=2823881 RepID=UPI00404B00C7